MPKVVLAPDSFKGTLGAGEVRAVLSRVVLEALPEAKIVEIPMADGGEGTADAMLAAIGGGRVTLEVTGPFPDESVQASYAMLPGNTAVVEIASTAGLPMVEGRRNPLLTTSKGTGELALDAVKRGASRVVFALGGSATNDAGCGILAALGFSFIDNGGRAFLPAGGSLSRISSIVHPEGLPRAEFSVMCDVTNPFHGSDGAAFVFAPQKGADSASVALLDKGLAHFAAIAEKMTGVDLQALPGAGAAGGAAGGLAAFLGARLKPGAEAVLDASAFDSRAKDALFVVTGEGRLDSQSARGKVVSSVAKRCLKLGVPLLCVAGSVAPNTDISSMGIRACLAVSDGEVPPPEKAGPVLEEAFRAWLPGALETL